MGSEALRLVVAEVGHTFRIPHWLRFAARSVSARRRISHLSPQHLVQSTWYRVRGASWRVRCRQQRTPQPQNLFGVLGAAA